MPSFATRFLPWTAVGRERLSRWQMAKRRLVVLGVSCLGVAALILACLWFQPPPPPASPFTATNARRLAVRGTPRAEAEKILGASGTLIRPGDDPDRAIKWGDELQLGTFPVPMFGEIQGADYAIQWGQPGHFLRIYFDKNDQVVGIEGSTAADPPTLAERVRKWLRGERA